MKPWRGNPTLHVLLMNYSKTSRYDSFHHSRLQERILDGGTSSRFQETHLYGTTLWQIPMDRLPMGTVVAQDIFQSKLDSIFIGMEGVTGIADDMVIASRDEMEYNRNFLAVYEQRPDS